MILRIRFKDIDKDTVRLMMDVPYSRVKNPNDVVALAQGLPNVVFELYKMLEDVSRMIVDDGVVERECMRQLLEVSTNSAMFKISQIYDKVK